MPKKTSIIEEMPIPEEPVSSQKSAPVEVSLQILAALQRLTEMVEKERPLAKKTPRADRSAPTASIREDRRRAVENKEQLEAEGHDMSTDDVDLELEDEEEMNRTFLGIKEAPKYVGKLTPFAGERSGLALETWIFQTEQYFEINQVPRGDRVPIASMQLKGSALLWWRERCNAVKRNVEDKILTWTDFATRLRKYLQPADQARLLKFKLKDLTQIGSITNYVSEFLEIVLQLPDATEDEKLDSFIWGLNARTKCEVLYRNPSTLEKAITIAERYESFILRDRKESEFNRTGSEDRSRSENSRFDRNSDRSTVADRSTMKSYARSSDRSDKSMEDLEIDRVETHSNSDSESSTGPTCFNCGKSGHIRRNCGDPVRSRSDSTSGQSEN